MLLPPSDAARDVLLALNSPDFAPFSAAYATTIADCCSGYPRLPSSVHEPLTALPPLERPATVAYRRIAGAPDDISGERLELSATLDAIVLHDRSLTFIHSAELASGATVRRGPGAFAETLDHVVEHAERATRIAAPDWTERQLQRADGLRLAPDDLGDGWLPTHARSGDQVFEPSQAVGTICEPLLQIFANMSGSLRASRWFQTNGDDPVVLHQQTVGADTDPFRSLLTPDFNECAQVHDGVFPVLRLPVPAIQALDESTSAAFYEYESDDGLRHVAALVASWGTVSLLDMSGSTVDTSMLQPIIDALATRAFESSF